MRNNSKTSRKQRFKILATIIGICVIIFSYLIIHITYVGTRTKGGFFHAIEDGIRHGITHPFELSPFPFGAFKYIFAFLFLFGAVFFFVYWESKLRRHDDLETISGDSKWMTEEELKKYNKSSTEPLGSPEASALNENNAIVTNDIFLSMNAPSTGRNLNTLVIGGSGVGKSFRFVGPNILQKNCSMIVTDPSGDLYKKYGPYLEYHGYRVKCFNLDHMDKSNHYNPFEYIYSNKDIEILVTMIIQNTSSPNAKGDEFWEKCEIALLCALISYLKWYRPQNEQNFSMVKDLIRAADIDENNSSMPSKLDQLFEEQRKLTPDSFTMTQYDTFRLGAGKTLKSILISCAVRLQAFDLEDVRTLTDTDDIELDMISDEPTAIFIIVPTGETTFNFLAGLMYSQLFTRLYRYCENTAAFGWVVQDADGKVIKTFRASTAKESNEKAKKDAQEYLEICQGASVIQNTKLTEDFAGKMREFWEIRNGNHLISYRGDRNLAEEALAKIKKGKIVPTSKLGNQGHRCPIHVRFLLDEFANTGKIPDFTQKVSTIRKYEISTTIILQSITQLQNLYEKEWENISGNCDTTVYLGGGNDTATTEWLTKLLGKKTVIGMNMSFSGNGGSDSFQRQSIELYSLSQLRTMENQTCIVLLRGEHPFKGYMFDTPKHPAWDLLNTLPEYSFDELKHVYIQQQSHYPEIKEEDAYTDNVVNDDKNEKVYKESINEQAHQEAEDISRNMSLDGEIQVSDVTVVDNLDTSRSMSEIIDQTLGTHDGGSESGNIDEMLSFNFDDGEMSFSAAPMGESYV